MSSRLFTPVRVGPIELPNRISVSPMCQYSAIDGTMQDWHLMHLMNLAVSGAGLIVIEATHVEPAGRITHGCCGLYSDENERALKRVIDACRGLGGTRIGVQIAHAGRKASSQRPWEGGRALGPDQRPWPTVAPSAIPLAEGWHTPAELDRAGMTRIRDAFVAAMQRALRAGADLIEVHSAHGYLLCEFLSPLTNRRTDGYGGSRENRMRFPLEVFEAMRAACPKDRAIGARIPGSDFVEGAWGPDDGAAYARALQSSGCDYVTMSGGGVVLDAKIPVGPGYQVPFAEQVKREVGITTCAVGMITEPAQAEAIVADGKADFIAIARAFLFDPRWPWRAAEKLGVDLPCVGQYARAHPKVWPPGRSLD